MKYPEHTVSKPVTGSEAKELIAAIDSGSYVANEAARATIERIATRHRSNRSSNGKAWKVRGR